MPRATPRTMTRATLRARVSNLSRVWVAKPIDVVYLCTGWMGWGDGVGGDEMRKMMVWMCDDVLVRDGHLATSSSSVRY